MKRYVLVLFLLQFFSGYAQNTINNYQYVLVPEKFSFLKQNDQYSVNSLTKGLLEEKGFKVYFDNADLPGEVAADKCRALIADVTDKSGMFSTTLILLLKDCRGNIVFKSKEGKSREKEFKVSYHMALRDAFTSLNQVSYAYTAPNTISPQPVTTTATPVAAKPADVAIPQPAATLYAQAIVNGYQLIDTAPKIVLTLLKTSVADYFIATSATANGIALKKNGEWFFEYYKDGQLVSEKLAVKF